MVSNVTDRSQRRKILGVFFGVLLGVGLFALMTTCPALADYKQDIIDMVTNLTGIIGTIFQAVGVVLAIYSVGQLILAFKNEDADAKARASTQLVVGIVLMAMPAILDSLNITQYFTT